MRKNLSPLVLVAALAASPFLACKDTVRETDDLSKVRAEGDLPSGAVDERVAGSAPEVPDASARVAPAGARAEAAPAVADDGPVARNSVVVIPVDELFPSSRDDASGAAIGLGVRPAAETPSGPAARVAPGDAPAPSAGPGVLPSTPGLPPPAEAVPVSVTAVIPAPTVPEPGIGGGAPTELRVTLVSGEDVAIPPGARIEVASAIALIDVRVRLFDENDRILPSRDRVTVGKGTEVRIVPETPLPPGSAFRLEIGGQLQPYPTDVNGKHFSGHTYRFHTTGEKPSPPPPPTKKQRRRR